MLHKLKNYLKELSLTKKLYVSLQCLIVLIQYKIIKFYYFIKPIKNNKLALPLDLNNDSLEVFYFGGDELQDKSGFIQGLNKYCNLTYFTKEDGSYGSYSFGPLNRKKNIVLNQKRLLELLAQMENKPDILLMQTWEWRIGLETLEKVRNMYPKIKIVNISMDDRHSFWIYGFKKFGSAGLVPQLDYVFTTSSEFVEFYEKEGCKAYFYPLASDDNIFRPLNIPKKYDVGFVGAKYGVRDTIINKLIKKNINVKAYGNGWHSGRLPIEDTNLFYNQCKIVLGVSTILGCNNFISMKLRDFDVPMSGSVYITNYNSDTAKIFLENEEAIYFKEVDECVNKIVDLINKEEKLNEFRSNTLKKAKNNTYEKRIENMIQKIIGNKS